MMKLRLHDSHLTMSNKLIQEAVKISNKQIGNSDSESKNLLQLVTSVQQVARTVYEVSRKFYLPISISTPPTR